jgi:hypothetical protein
MFLAFAFGVTAIIVPILFGVFTILAWVAEKNAVKHSAPDYRGEGPKLEK